MSDEGSISVWIQQLRAGEVGAAEKLWQRYYLRLISMARRSLGDASRRVADEDDVVIHAFDSFCAGAAEGRFPRLNDREDLWQILMMLTSRKAADQLKELSRQKRGAGLVVGESALLSGSDLSGAHPMNFIADLEPTPENAAIVAEECRLLLERLDDDQLRKIAIARMEGYSIEEIAVDMHVNVRTVERKLKLIREIWTQEP